jgi:HEAT repeat protein
MSDDTRAQNRPFDALNSRGLAGKREYVRGLEQRRDEEALSLLVECLCDESSYLRELAEDALMRIGDRASAVLLPLLEQGLWYTRSSAARVLGRFGRRDAVPGLLRLAEDANASVGEAARDALVMIGRHGGAVAIARSLHRLPEGRRRLRYEEIQVRDRPLGERIDRMARNAELMATDAGHDLSDDHPRVRSAAEGLEWEVQQPGRQRSAT